MIMSEILDSYRRKNYSRSSPKVGRAKGRQRERTDTKLHSSKVRRATDVSRVPDIQMLFHVFVKER